MLICYFWARAAVVLIWRRRMSPFGLGLRGIWELWHFLGYTPEAMTSEKRILDNRRGTVGDFLQAALRGADVFRAVTAYFSVNGFDLLSGELRGVKDSRFLFGDPSSAAEVDKDGGRQKSFLMNEGKLALRDALRQKPLAKACAEWIMGGAKIRSVRHGFLHGKMYIADSDSKKGGGAVLGSSNFTQGGLSVNLEINLAVNNEPTRGGRINISRYTAPTV